MTTTTVSANQTSTGDIISSQQEQDVYGHTVDTTVLSSGLQVIENGGSSEGTYLDGAFAKAAIQDVDSGGIADSTEIGTYNTQYVFAGGKATNTIVDTAGVQYVYGLATNTILNESVQFVVSGGSAIGTKTESGGRQYVASGATATGTLLDNGTQLVEAGGSAFGTVIGDGSQLFLNDPTAYASGTVIENGGSISLGYTSFEAGGSASLDPESDVLTITDGGSTITLQLAGSYEGEYFDLSSESGRIEITASDTPCYCADTLIATQDGQTSVDHLEIGDLVRVKSGALRAIKWIGTRRFSNRFIVSNRDILPICIRAGALENNVPARDLWVSPHHAMYLDGILIEAKDLVNGASIYQADRVEGELTYFHIELDSHDVIIAEGALSETFVDDDSRAMFHNAMEYRGLYPNEAPVEPIYCAPRVYDGAALETVRAKIKARVCLFEEFSSIAS